MKCMLWYLKDALDVGLVNTNNNDIFGIVVDYNYVGDLDKSILNRMCIILRSSVISWKITLQCTIALSTIEARYMTTTKIVKEILLELNMCWQYLKAQVCLNLENWS